MRATATRTLASGLILSAVLLLGVQPAVSACVERQPTRATFPGPHDFRIASYDIELWREGEDGEPLLLRARVLDTCGKPVAGASVRVLHANPHGAHEPDRWRTHVKTSDRGEFQIITALPGYAGGLPRHIHFIIGHPAYQELVTRLFFRNDPAVDPTVEDLTMTLDEFQRAQGKGWVAGYEFVLTPK